MNWCGHSSLAEVLYPRPNSTSQRPGITGSACVSIITLAGPGFISRHAGRGVLVLFGIDIPVVTSMPHSVQKLASRLMQWEVGFAAWAKAAPEAESKKTAKYKNRRL